MIQKIVFLFLILIGSFTLQASKIIGFAPDFIGKKVILYTYSDYLTLTKIKLAEAIVSSSDSTFILESDVKQVIKVILEIENTNAEIYLGPKTDYEIYFKPDRNMAQSFATHKATTYFKNLDTADVNYKILQYQNWFDEYLYVNQAGVLSKGIAPYIDTFKRYAYEAYAKEANPYFVNFVRYNVATLEKLKVSAKYRKPKIALYMEYIKPFPVYAFNDQYMNYIKSFYGNDFKSFANQIQSDIVLAIKHASPSRLMAAMHRDIFFEKDEIRELMMVNMLGNAYYGNEYAKGNIKVMLDSVSKFAKFKSSGLAANNILNEVTTIAPGYPAPNFKFELSENENIELSKLTGQFVYVNFFANWNTNSVKEMKLLEELVAEYGDYVSFISFCTDEDKSAYEAFKTAYPTIQWPVIYLGKNHPIIKNYQAASIPYYVLIDQSGFIASAPALGPSPNGVGLSIADTFLLIKRAIEKEKMKNE
ncbi:MAG: TlpA family protein disulfide reductase [Crocinitomicaceae bacterium]